MKNINKFQCTDSRAFWGKCLIQRAHTHADNDVQVLLCDCGEQHCWDLYRGCLPDSHKDPKNEDFNLMHCENCHGDCKCFDAQG